MSNILQFNGSSSQSPFDAIRQIDEDGNEFWSARDLQIIFEYKEWRKFNDAVERARISCEVTGGKASDHFVPAAKMVELGSGSMRQVVDFNLSRFGAYMVAMNGDPRKPRIAEAQSYFALKTREAEVAIPQMSEDLRRLEMENKNLELQIEAMKHKKELMASAGLLAMTAPALAEAIILPGVQVIEKTEVIERTVVKSSDGRILAESDGVGITAIQRQFGFNSTKQAWGWLESIGYGKESGHWMPETTAHDTLKLPRSAMKILKEKATSKVGSRQKLIGEF
jgi:hypothetical protein